MLSHLHHDRIKPLQRRMDICKGLRVFRLCHVRAKAGEGVVCDVTLLVGGFEQVADVVRVCLLFGGWCSFLSETCSDEAQGCRDQRSH